jgi:hypothetical protein
MIQHVWSLLCLRVLTDSETKAPSIIDLVDQLTIRAEAELPVKIPTPLVLVTNWTRSVLDEPTTGAARVTVISPSGEHSVLSTTAIDLTEHTRMRVNLLIQTLEIREVGRHIFQVEAAEDLDWAEPVVAARIPLDVAREH